MKRGALGATHLVVEAVGRLLANHLHEHVAFVLVMAVGSVAGTFVGGYLLGLVPGAILLPALAGILLSLGMESLAAPLM